MLIPATAAMRVVVAALLPSRSKIRTVASRIALTVARERDCLGSFRAVRASDDFTMTNPSRTRIDAPVGDRYHPLQGRRKTKRCSLVRWIGGIHAPALRSRLQDIVMGIRLFPPGPG